MSFDGQLGRAGLAGRDDDAERALPRAHAELAPRGVPAVPRLRPGRRRGRPLDGLCATARGQANAGRGSARPARADGRPAARASSGRRRCAARPASGSPDSWSALAFRTTNPPDLAQASEHRAAEGRRREGQGNRDGARPPTRCRPTRARSSRSAWSARRDVRLALAPARAAGRAAWRLPQRCGSSGGGARYAVTFTNLDVLASVARPEDVAAALGAARALPARAGRRLGRAGPSARATSPCRPSARPSCCWSTSRARCGRPT